MGLSSSTVIHFTSTKKSLKGILSDNFRLRYCSETIHWSDGSKFELHVPMVCFCDIPLSQIKDHISHYGRYGIGLSRDWAMKNKLNPVLYIEPGSNLATSCRDLVGYFIAAMKDSSAASSDLKKARKQIVDVLRYIKNYEGPHTKGGKNISNYRFSDEREWRFVPHYSSECQALYAASNYAEAGVGERASQSLSTMRLEFEPNDVKYIIINDDDEIGEFIKHLRDAKGKKYTQDDIERLTTRILTAEQIHQDI